MTKAMIEEVPLPMEVRNMIGHDCTRSFRFASNRNLRMIWNEKHKFLNTFNPKSIVLSDDEIAARAELESQLKKGLR